MQTLSRPKQVVIDLTEDDEIVGEAMNEDTKVSDFSPVAAFWWWLAIA